MLPAWFSRWNSSSNRHLFCRFGCAVGLFQSLAWMANPKALVIAFDRDRARDCKSCSTTKAPGGAACDSACPMRLTPRNIKRQMFACVQCGQCITESESSHAAQQRTPNLEWKIGLDAVRETLQCRTAGAGRPDAADAAQRAAARGVPVGVEYLCLGQAGGRDHGERCREQRKPMLPAVQQVQRVSRHALHRSEPDARRAADEEDAAWRGQWQRCERVETCGVDDRDWLASRELIHTASLHGVNSMCSKALPGCGVRTTCRESVSMTCTWS